MALGLLSVGLLGVYSASRAGLATAPPAVQVRLHLAGAAAALASLIGLILYFGLPKTYRSSKVFVAGVLLDFVASVWGFLLISL